MHLSQNTDKARYVALYSAVGQGLEMTAYCKRKSRNNNGMCVKRLRATSNEGLALGLLHGATESK